MPPTDDSTDLRCERVRLLLSRVIDDAATPDQRAEVDAHLPDCADCRTAAAADHAVRTRLAEPAVVPPGFRDRVIAATTRRMREIRAQNRFLMVGAAAAVLLAALTLVLQPDAGSAPGDDVATGDDRTRARTALTTSLAAGRLQAAGEERPR